jgi:gas vesicle protein
MTRTGRIVTTAGVTLAGAAAGYIVGVLSAPASGRETRRRLGRRIEEEADEFMHKAESTLKDAQKKLADAVRC